MEVASTKLLPETVKKLERMAAEQDRSISWLIRELIEEALAARAESRRRTRSGS